VFAANVDVAASATTDNVTNVFFMFVLHNVF
jgi:hypothetical protein